MQTATVKRNLRTSCSSLYPHGLRKNTLCVRKYQPHYSTCYFLWHGLLKTWNFRRCCRVWRYKDLMLWFSFHLSLPACGPCDVPSNKGWAGGREWRAINTIHSMFFQVPLFHIREVHPRRLRRPFRPKCFYMSSLIRRLIPAMWAWCKAASFKKEGLLKVTFSWKHTIVHSVSTLDMIVIQLTMVSVLLAPGRKLLLSQLTFQNWLLHLSVSFSFIL